MGGTGGTGGTVGTGGKWEIRGKAEERGQWMKLPCTSERVVVSHLLEACMLDLEHSPSTASGAT